jgi:hypothetical protein
MLKGRSGEGRIKVSSKEEERESAGLVGLTTKLKKTSESDLSRSKGKGTLSVSDPNLTSVVSVAFVIRVTGKSVE